MSDLISRQAAIVAVKDALLAWSSMPEWRDDKITEALVELPSAQPDVPDINDGDTISRQAAQERQRVAQKRRYTFGSDEFNLEAAYHDCKLVFDGITDDDSYQEADTGLILYYANEIIYALQSIHEGVCRRSK